MAMLSELRPSPLAGTWYEANPERLTRALDGYLSVPELPELNGDLLGVIVPHAGHRYSGPVAGYAFAAARSITPNLVAVISPMHQPYSQPLITTAHSAYATPLGAVPVDFEGINALDAILNQRLGFGLAQVAHDHEHSLEIELPFLQHIYTQPWKLLPVMVRAISPKVSQTLGKALAEVLLGKNALLVASTDLSHFFTQTQANVLDAEMLARIESFDPQAIFEAEQQDKGYACGLGALTAVMWACREMGANTIKVLQHATSGDVTGDTSSVVGYGAAVILKTAIA